jgi:ferredoxin
MRGISEDRIFTELFEAPPAETDFSALEGNADITLIEGDKEHTFKAAKNQILLNSILMQGYDAPYSCLNGVCSSCIGKVESGEAQMAKNETLSKEQVEKGYILTCQAYALSDKVTISLDKRV